MATWDVHCRVIDNFGDIGVSWRLACGLAARGHAVRLFVDDDSALRWMAPRGAPGVTVNPGPVAARDGAFDGDFVADVVIEAFGCGLPRACIAGLAARGRAGRPVAWVNLEYLSAEDWVARSHGLSSPVHGGEAAGIHRWFYFPGFTAGSGGLLREPGLARRQEDFDRGAWLQAAGVDWEGERVATLFCYEPAALVQLAGALARERAWLLVAPGRGAQALAALGPAIPPDLRVRHLPWLAQEDFDHLLWAGDLNFVRGEDSLVRALWAGRGLVWQAYPQQDGAHDAKWNALMDWMDAPADLRHAHEAWNGPAGAILPVLDWDGWGQVVRAARDRAWAEEDLVSRLEAFVAGVAGRGGPEHARIYG
jgi:uncharacterized repeat protein (TIGR03837 family)